MNKSELHKDHRSRMRDRFKKNGLAGFERHEILEMILFSAIPRRNTNDIAHGLLDKFDDISGVLTASEEELSAVDGIGETVAGKIRFLGEFFDSVSGEVFRNVSLANEDSAGMYAMLRMNLAPAESATAVYLDAAGMIIAEEQLYRGKFRMTDDLPHYIAAAAKSHGASEILLMHNHKKEPLQKSPDDTLITARLREEAEALGISRVVHVIVSEEGYIFI